MRFRIEQTSAASPQQLYDVMLDVERWPDWMGGVRRAGWQKRGAPGTGVGGVRRFGARALPVSAVCGGSTLASRTATSLEVDVSVWA